MTRLTCRGGRAAALAPLGVFLGGVAWLALHGAPDERGFWPVLLAALTAGLLRTAWRGAFIDQAPRRTRSATTTPVRNSRAWCARSCPGG